MRLFSVFYYADANEQCRRSETETSISFPGEVTHTNDGSPTHVRSIRFFLFFVVYTHTTICTHIMGEELLNLFHGILWWPLNSMATASWMDARLGCHCPAAILIPHYPPKFSCGRIISQRPLCYTFAVYRSRSSLRGQATPYYRCIYYTTLFIIEWQLTFDRAWRFQQVNHTALRERGEEEEEKASYN